MRRCKAIYKKMRSIHIWNEMKVSYAELLTLILFKKRERREQHLTEEQSI